MNDLRFPRPLETILDAVGHTPLVRLRRVTAGIRTPVYAKAEFFNPGGSVKDRIGLAIVEAAERAGRLRPGGTIVEATSGNTGVALAMAAAIKGYRCIFTIPDKMSQEKVRLLKAFGAEVIVTPTAVPPGHPEHYLEVAKRIVRETPNAILADQFYNPANPEAHYRTTGPEIWAQTEGRVTHFVAGAGTGGTITGVGRYLKEQNPRVRVIAADPIGSILHQTARGCSNPEAVPYKVEGIGQDKIPGTLDLAVVDEWRAVDDRTAFAMARRLTREEGLFVGGSSGLLAHVALEVAREVDDPAACVVFVLCDTGERYLSKVFNEEWLRENRLLDPSQTTAGELLRTKTQGPAELITVGPQTTVREALALITRYDISQVPVFEGDRPIGQVSESGLSARVLADPSILDEPVGDHLEAAPPIVDPATPFGVLAQLLAQGHGAVLVRDDGRWGILTRFDVLQVVASSA